jgi:hypothetical protein
MAAGSHPTATIGVQLPCLIAAAMVLTAMNTAASAEIMYNQRAFDLMLGLLSRSVSKLTVSSHLDTDKLT